LAALLFARGEAGTLKKPLTANAREALRTSARRGLQDPAPDVRRTAVSAVVAARDVDAIPLLRFMAEKDSDAKGTWSVRALAAEGIKRLQESR
jgi:HEAT repeat protein